MELQNEDHFIFLTFPNIHTNSRHLLIKLLVDGLVAHCRLVQVYKLVLNVH